ncbi:hypothetical protein CAUPRSCDRAFT_2014, partial [Caulochytrium protostelioides]
TFDVHYDDTTESITALVIATDRFDLVLGRTWLKKHNPLVDWVKNEVTLNIDGRMQKIKAVATD